MLLAYTQPGRNQTLDEYHDWYNDEHGPNRTRLSWIRSGLRLRADDGRQPEYLATYDVGNLDNLNLDEYTTLLVNRSEREKKVMSELERMDKRLYRLVSERGEAPDPPAKVVMYISLSFKPEDVDEVNRWYEEEDIPLLSKVPGWRRTRRYCLIEPSASGDLVELLAVHEYDSKDGFDSPEAKTAGSTSWGTRVVQELAQKRSRRVMKLFHVFLEN